MFANEKTPEVLEYAKRLYQDFGRVVRENKDYCDQQFKALDELNTTGPNECKFSSYENENYK